MGAKTGSQMHLYHNTGTHETPVWVELCEITDVNVDGLSRTWAELKRRCHDHTKGLPGKIGMTTFSVTMIHGLAAAVFDRVRADFFGAVIREYAIMNGDIDEEGSEGLRLPAGIQDFPWNQPLEEASTHELKLVYAYKEDDGTETDMEWYEVAGSESGT